MLRCPPICSHHASRISFAPRVPTKVETHLGNKPPTLLQHTVHPPRDLFRIRLHPVKRRVREHRVERLLLPLRLQIVPIQQDKLYVGSSRTRRELVLFSGGEQVGGSIDPDDARRWEGEGDFPRAAAEVENCFVGERGEEGEDRGGCGGGINKTCVGVVGGGGPLVGGRWGGHGDGEEGANGGRERLNRWEQASESRRDKERCRRGGAVPVIPAETQCRCPSFRGTLSPVGFEQQRQKWREASGKFGEKGAFGPFPPTGRRCETRRNYGGVEHTKSFAPRAGR